MNPSCRIPKPLSRGVAFDTERDQIVCDHVDEIVAARAWRCVQASSCQTHTLYEMYFVTIWQAIFVMDEVRFLFVGTRHGDVGTGTTCCTRIFTTVLPPSLSCETLRHFVCAAISVDFCLNLCVLFAKCRLIADPRF